jgi:hypothetical protein
MSAYKMIKSLPDIYPTVIYGGNGGDSRTSGLSLDTDGEDNCHDVA